MRDGSLITLPAPDLRRNAAMARLDEARQAMLQAFGACVRLMPPADLAIEVQATGNAMVQLLALEHCRG